MIDKSRMKGDLDLLSGLKQEAEEILGQFSQSDRESLLIQNWMSHDARWFAAAAQKLGMQTANQLNQTAARDLGATEARRIVRKLQLPKIESLDDYLLTQEVFISLLGPDLIKYQVDKIDNNTFEIKIRKCLAYDNIKRASMVDDYVCGIMARLNGWLDGLEIDFAMEPPIGLCLKCQDTDCVYRFSFKNLN